MLWCTKFAIKLILFFSLELSDDGLKEILSIFSYIRVKEGKILKKADEQQKAVTSLVPKLCTVFTMLFIYSFVFLRRVTDSNNCN